MIEFIIGLLMGVALMAVVSASAYHNGWIDAEEYYKEYYRTTKCAACGCEITGQKYGMKHLSLLGDTPELDEIDLCEDCFKTMFQRREENDQRETEMA